MTTPTDRLDQRIHDLEKESKFLEARIVQLELNSNTHQIARENLNRKLDDLAYVLNSKISKIAELADPRNSRSFP